MRKHFLAIKESKNLFNVETREFDIPITGYTAIPKPYDSIKEAMAAKRVEERPFPDEEPIHEFIVLSIDEDINTDGKESGTYRLPKLSENNQISFSSYSF